MTPTCMTPDELARWQDANRVLRTRATTPCSDCPVAFAQQMRGESRCNGQPGPQRPGRAVMDAHLIRLHRRGAKYASEAERRAARRLQWREYKARVRAA